MNSNSLALKETILGVLQSKDRSGNGSGIIHTSDFKSALTELGFPMGSQVVEDILVSCVVDVNGNLDFSGFAKELKRQRHVVNSLPQPAKLHPTSTGAAPKPWRADVAHNQKRISETQTKLVQEHRTELQQAYKRYTSNSMNDDQMRAYIKSLGLVITKDLESLFRHSRTGEVPFLDFMRALVHYDSSISSLDPGFAAGGSTVAEKMAAETASGHGHALFAQRKRVDWNKRLGQIERSEDPIKPAKKGSTAHNFYSKSDGVMNTVFNCSKGQINSVDTNHFNKNTSGINIGMDKASEFTTVAQYHMQQGQGKKGDLKFNSEQQIIREQVLAALRKLDNGELSMTEFQHKIFGIGIELPEVVVTLLERGQLTGKLDLRKCVQILDGAIFKVLAQENVVPPAVLENLKQRYMQALKAKGVGSIAALGSMFREFDSDGNGVLSFGEFKQLCKDFDLMNNGMTDEDLRILFLEYDTDGSGTIDFTEFKNSMRGKINAKRRNVVQLAFKRLDRKGVGEVTWDYFTQEYGVSFHPDVANGIKTESDVLHDLSGYAEHNGVEFIINYVEFIDMLSDISSMVPDDDDFVDLIRVSFHLDPNGFAPAAPDYVVHQCGAGQSVDKVRAPMARQGHGDCISWNQEQSTLEKRESARNSVPVRKLSVNRTSSSIPLNQWKVADDAYTKAAEEEFRIDGGSTKHIRNDRNKSHESLLAWNTKRSENSRLDVSEESSRNLNQEKVNNMGSAGSGVTTAPTEYVTSSCATNAYNQVGDKVAGKRHQIAEHNGFTNKNTKWSEFKLREHGVGQTPFGVDTSGKFGLTSELPSSRARPKSKSTGNTNQVKSLAELMASRQ